MVVIVRKKVKTAGIETNIEVFLPEDSLLTKKKKIKARKLDNLLKKKIQKINKCYDKLDFKTKKNALPKWKWLGEEIDKIIKSVNLIEKKDIDKNIIWPAMAQYFRSELKRGLEDKKRSGTKKDHYRKCWLLALKNNTDWVSSWYGWDQLAERGEQVIYNDIILKILEENFANIKPPLKTDEYPLIGKRLVEKIPSLKNRANVDVFSRKEINNIVKSIKKEILKKRKDEKN